MKTYTFLPVFTSRQGNRPLNRLAAATITLFKLSLLGWALLFSQASWGQSAPVKEWDKAFGANWRNYERPIVTIPTSDGGYLSAGTIYTDDYSSEYKVVKHSIDGTRQWEKQYGGTDTDELFSVIQTADGGYLLAGYSISPISGNKTQGIYQDGSDYYGDYWVVKITSTGIKQWDRRFGGTNHDYLASAIQTADGGYLLAGYSYSDISGDKTQSSWGSTDCWIVKITSTGIKQWDRRFGGTGWDELSSAIQTSDGGFLLAGPSQSPISGDKTQGTGAVELWLVKTTREPMINEAIMSSTTPVISIGSFNNYYYDPGFVADYTHKLDITQTFKPVVSLFGGRGQIRLSFTSFQLENNYDYLYIYDGCSTSAPLIGVYTGSNSPGTVTSTSGCLTVRFVSDYSIAYTGWEATITPVSSPLPPRARLSAEQEAPEAASPLRLAATPNPFSERVSLSFQVAQTQPVVLAVYDKQGRFLEQVFAGEAQGSKEYQVEWAAKNQKAGLYIAKLSTGSQVVHQKLILVR